MGRQKLGELLKNKGVIDSEQLRELLKVQSEMSTHIRLGELVVAEGHIDERTLTVLLGSQSQVPIVLHLERVDIDGDAAACVPHALAKRFCVVPLRCYAPNTLIIATNDPCNEILFRALEQHTGMTIKASIAPKRDIGAAIHRVYERMQLDGEDQRKPKPVASPISALEAAVPIEPAWSTPSMAIDDAFGGLLENTNV